MVQLKPLVRGLRLWGSLCLDLGPQTVDLQVVVGTTGPVLVFEWSKWSLVRADEHAQNPVASKSEVWRLRNAAACGRTKACNACCKRQGEPLRRFIALEAVEMQQSFKPA